MNITRDFNEDSNSNFYREREKNPAFQLNKFQSEYNLSFNQEMAKIIAYALQNSEDFLEKQGKNIPPPLFALLSRLEDVQKPKFYKDYSKSRDFDKIEDEYANRDYPRNDTRNDTPLGDYKEYSR
jgi:hypothetical protein